MQLIKDKFTEENCLQFQAEVSFNTHDGVRTPLCFTIQKHQQLYLTEIANCVNADKLWLVLKPR